MSLLHVRAVSLALGLVVLAAPLMGLVASLLVRPFMRELLAARPHSEKNQGMQVQLEAMQRPDVLPVFGSSELTTQMPMRPDGVFDKKPTGFQVCPVGRAGNTTFMMAQKIAALGNALRGRKMAFIICNTWFRKPEAPEDQVAGNFSPLQTISYLQDPALDEGLRRRFVNRLLEYPGSTKDYGLIDAYLHTLTEQGWMAAAKKALLNPLLRMQRAWLRWDDELGSVEALLKEKIIFRPKWTEQAAHIPWSQLIEKKESEVSDQDKQEIEHLASLDDGTSDEEFLGAMRPAKEWDDFALLLDTLKYYKADPLIISVPLPGPVLNHLGVSPAAREYYHHRIKTMCRDRGFRVETFADQELAIDFLVGSSHTHLQEKGWLYVDRLLDDFFHDRIPQPNALRGPEAPPLRLRDELH